MKKRIKLFNKVPFDALSKKDLLFWIFNQAISGKKRLVLNMNTFGVVTYLKNNKYSRIINKADLIYPDGWGPVIASRVGVEILPERLNVGDFIEELLIGIKARKLRLYLLGCEEDTVIKTYKICKKKGIKICGFHNGFFSVTQEEDVLHNIIISKPNIVLVGMGVPMQEYFIDRNWKKLPSAVYMGIGGVFYYITDIKSRAPVWMRNCGLEWIYRLFQEPRRLWKRYAIDNLYFIYIFLKHLLLRKVLIKEET